MLNSIVSSKWLKSNLDNPNLIILDSSQQNKQNGLDKIQIKGARYFDIKTKFSDTKSTFPNAFPNINQFEKSCKELGINKSNIIVVYDKIGVFSSARVWWMFKTMNHANVFVLDGGLPDWILNNGETEITKNRTYKFGNFKAKFNTENIWYFSTIKNNILHEKALIIDARSHERFTSLVPESRANLRSGKIPKSINIPYTKVLENGKFKSKKELNKVFLAIKTNQQLVFSCGSGITACIVLLASELVLKNRTAIYDGSWTEFAQLEND